MNEDVTSWLYNFVNYFLSPFSDYLSYVSYQILIQRIIEGVFVIFVSGCVSALWGCFGAITALRRSKRG